MCRSTPNPVTRLVFQAKNRPCHHACDFLANSFRPETDGEGDWAWFSFAPDKDAR